MVLTAEELLAASDKGKKDFRIYSALFTRRTTNNFAEQAACDREIQRYLLHKGTIAYKFNCCVVHQPWKFKQISPLSDHGWGIDGPNDEKLMTIYRSLSIYEKNFESDEEKAAAVNDLNSKSLGAVYIEKVPQDGKDGKSPLSPFSGPPEYESFERRTFAYRDHDSQKPGCFADLLACLFL